MPLPCIVNVAVAAYVDGASRTYQTSTHPVTGTVTVGTIPLSGLPISLAMIADRTNAQPGDRVRYTITIQNTLAAALGVTQLHNTIPAGILYAPDTAKLDGTTFDPSASGATLNWSLPSVGQGAIHTLTYDAVVFPSVQPNTMITNQVSATAILAGTGTRAAGSASATIVIVEGMFSGRYPITGRVFIARRGAEHFTAGDSGIPNVRVYLEDGSSVLTDADGRFSFPAVRPGMHAIRLDTSTLPKNVHPFPDRRMNSTHATQQLVHGILDNGVIEDIEFALEPAR